MWKCRRCLQSLMEETTRQGWVEISRGTEVGLGVAMHMSSKTFNCLSREGRFRPDLHPKSLEALLKLPKPGLLRPTSTYWHKSNHVPGTLPGVVHAPPHFIPWHPGSGYQWHPYFKAEKIEEAKPFSWDHSDRKWWKGNSNLGSVSLSTRGLSLWSPVQVRSVCSAHQQVLPLLRLCL